MLTNFVLRQHVVEPVICTADIAIHPIPCVLHDVIPQLIRSSEGFVAIGALMFVRIIVVEQHMPAKTFPPATFQPADVAHKVLLLMNGLHVDLQLLLDVEPSIANWTNDVLLLGVRHHVDVECGTA